MSETDSPVFASLEGFPHRVRCWECNGWGYLLWRTSWGWPAWRITCGKCWGTGRIDVRAKPQEATP